MRVLVFIFLTTLLACSDKNTEESINKDILGFYQIESFNSTDVADLNDDGISSHDFKNELSDFPYSSIQLRIIELPKHDPFDLGFTIQLPYPNELVDKPYGHLQYNHYAIPIRLYYQNGELGFGENEITFEDKIIFESFEIVDQSKIQAHLKMKLYDFTELVWKNYNCEIIYTKIE